MKTILFILAIAVTSCTDKPKPTWTLTDSYGPFSEFTKGDSVIKICYVNQAKPDTSYWHKDGDLCFRLK